MQVLFPVRILEQHRPVRAEQDPVPGGVHGISLLHDKFPNITAIKAACHIARTAGWNDDLPKADGVKSVFGKILKALGKAEFREAAEGQGGVPDRRQRLGKANPVHPGAEGFRFLVIAVQIFRGIDPAGADFAFAQGHEVVDAIGVFIIIIPPAKAAAPYPGHPVGDGQRSAFKLNDRHGLQGGFVHKQPGSPPFGLRFHQDPAGQVPQGRFKLRQCDDPIPRVEIGDDPAPAQGVVGQGGVYGQAAQRGVRRKHVVVDPMLLIRFDPADAVLRPDHTPGFRRGKDGETLSRLNLRLSRFRAEGVVKGGQEQRSAFGQPQVGQGRRPVPGFDAFHIEAFVFFLLFRRGGRAAKRPSRQNAQKKKHGCSCRLSFFHGSSSSGSSVIRPARDCPDATDDIIPLLPASYKRGKPPKKAGECNKFPERFNA